MRTRVKICCISSRQEAELAIRMGADALGLVGHMPSGPGVIEDALIQSIAGSVPPPTGTFLLTSETAFLDILTHYDRVHTNTVQLVDAVETDTYVQLSEARPHLKIVQVIHVQDESNIEEAIEISGQVDALLLDSGNPKAATKILGGTGHTHDWSLSRRIVETVDCPVFLAGGLRAENVREAMETVQPFGLDLCSGVRTNGRLDPRKLESFMEAVHL